MALNNEFKVKNDLNTLGRILSGGQDIAQIFAASNTTWTLSASNGSFAVAGGDILQVQGDNGVDVRVGAGTDTARISGINATTSTKGVASFNSASFDVASGAVSIKTGGVTNAQLSGFIEDSKLNTISTAGKVSNSATTATSNNSSNAIVARGASGEFSSGSITATGNLSASGTVTGNIINAVTGYKINNAATSGHVLRGNGTNFVSSTLSASDIPTLNQNTTGSAATLATTRTLWGQAFNGSQTVTGSLTGVGNITGSGAITIQPFAINQDISLTTSGTGEVNIAKVDIDSGAIDGTTIGASSASTGRFTQVVVDNITIDANTISSTNANGDIILQPNGIGDVSISADTLKIGDTNPAFLTTNGNSTLTVNTNNGTNSGTIRINHGVNGNIDLQPNGIGITTVSGNLSASGTVAAPTLSASDNLFVGDVLVRTRSTNNVFIGSSGTGNNGITGSNNLVVGGGAGNNLNTGLNNNFLGPQAGFSNTTGSNNNFFGSSAGLSNIAGSDNNFLGSQAGVNVIGNNNNIFGAAAGYGASSANASSNNIFGKQAGSGIFTGSFNNFLGYSAGRSTSTGGYNNFLGNNAGCNNTSGFKNNFIGDSSGILNTAGFINNFFGENAGFSNTTGSYNNFIGSGAGLTNEIGSNNTIIGKGANVATNALSGVIVLGTGAVATESHQILFSTNNVLLKSTGSTFEIGSPSLTDNLTVYGTVSSTGIIGASTGFRINNAATTGHVLRGNGTNFVSSTLAASDIASGQALTKTDDTNVTLTLGGTPSTTLLKSTSLTLGWTGQLAAGRGGTGNAFTQFTGPASTVKTFTLPNASTTILTTDAAVTILQGGTGATTQQGAINNLAGGVTSGQYLRGNGSNVVMSSIQAGDVPTLNQNTTGSAATLTTGRTIAISGDLSYTSPSFNGSTNVTAIGTLATVNSNVGSFTNASVTVNAKGLVTAVSSGTAPVTTVTGTSPVVSSGGTTPAISLAAGYGDTLNPYAIKTQKTFLAAPNAANGVPTFRTILASDVPTLNQNTTGSAATLTTTRTLWGQNFNGSQNVTGNLTSVGNITGTGAITIATGGSNQDITLSTSGTGEVNISKVDIDGGTIDGTPIGSSSASSGKFTNGDFSGNVNISGSLFVSGSATTINTVDLVVQDPIIYLAEGNQGDAVDMGFTVAYNYDQEPHRHAGFIRDASTEKWTLFSNLSSEVLSAININFSDPSLVIDTLRANIEGTLTGNVSGIAAQAARLQTGRTISTTGDVTYTSGSFDGTSNVTGTATIGNDKVTTAKILNSNVTYAKIQNVSATDRLLGRSSAGAGVIQEIVCTSAGRALLDDASASAQRDTLGVGSTQSVTFGEVIVNNGTKSVVSDVYNTTTATNVAILSTFANASYNSAKYTVQIKNTTTSARCALEIIASKNNTTWEGTVYGIVDPANLFTNVDITAGPTAQLVFTLNGVANYDIIAYTQAISD